MVNQTGGEMRKRIQMTAVAVAFIAALLFTVQMSSASNGSGAAGSVTFNKDVAPIFYAKCAECHRDGEVAPMSLVTYKESRPWAKSIREKIIKREMPPWHADPAHGSFRNDRRLTQ